jgi:AraC family carnitine catabolism transcriptional activator
MQFKTSTMQKWTKSSLRPVKIGILLFDQFSNLCLANCLEPLRAANRFSQDPAYEWDLVTLTGGAVESSSGMPVLPNAALLECAGWDYLFILASYGYREHDTASTRSALRRAAASTKTVVGLDTAPWLMASAGLLDGRRSTVHWEVFDRFSETFLRLQTERQHVVSDGNRITCAGALSALDLTLDLIADHLGQAMRLDIAHLFLQPEVSPTTPPVQNPHKDRLIHRAMHLMRQTLETPLSVPKLAAALACPAKTLERRFQSSLSAPPGKVYRHLRLSRAAQLIEGASLPVSEIAVRCGYDSPSAFTRAFKARYGRAPTQAKSHKP